MLTDFISITNLQRNLKSVFSSKQPMHIVLSNNTVSGLVFSKELTEIMMRSGVLDQLREELWELHDRETSELVKRERTGKFTPVPFDSYLKKHGLQSSDR